jgi:AcrR family transcriptional regulator
VSVAAAVPAEPQEALSPRQTEVLERALALLVEGGEKALTTAGVARAANCSKESLYKWFGDRDGLIAAVVTHQAGKVGVRAAPSARTDRAAFRSSLVAFAADLRRVLAGEVSIALNRVAIGQAGGGGGELGRLVLERGRRPIEVRISALLEAGRAAGHVAFDDVREAYRTLYGLAVRDMHVRLLLGDALGPSERDHGREAERAVDQFLRLHRAEP